MATHPSTPERVAQAEAEAHQFGSPGVGATGRDAYLQAIDGIAFGDDPLQGVVRGTTFIHPKLGFAFDAPDGFALENQTTALIGVGEGGGEALRLDSVAIAEFDARRRRHRLWLDRRSEDDPGRNDADRRAGRRDGDGAGRPVELPARRGAPRGRLYRLIFAAHTLSPAVDARFRASLESFHLINAQDSALAAARNIKIVTVGSADTSDAMAARMAFLPHALDQFLILNGLERGVPLVAGQRYKMVAE